MTQKTSPSWKFIWRSFVVSSVLFASAFAVINISASAICTNIVSFDCPIMYPISIFAFRSIRPFDLIVVSGLFGLLWLATGFLLRRSFPLLPGLLLAIVLMIGSNGIAGWYTGYVVAVDFGGDSYYQDMLRIEDPITLVRDYETLQQEVLYTHARTNPPGALLNLYLIHKLISDAGALSLFILIISGGLSGLFMWRIIRLLFADHAELAGYAMLLFLCIPAVQIYYTDTTDPIIATALLGSLYFLLDSSRRVYLPAAIICLFIASFSSFLSMFFLPVLVVLAIVHREYRQRVIIVLVSVVAIHAAIYLMGYNYLHSFLIASKFENPEGFRLLSDTPSYIGTRIESTGEIILFFTPFLFVYLVRGIPLMIRERTVLLTLSGSALLSFLGMMLIGVLSTGEAARAMVFVYPYLLFPVIYTLRDIPDYRIMLVCLVYSQTLFMQVIGIYFS